MANDGLTFSGYKDRNVDWQRSEYSGRLWDCSKYDITLQQLVSFNGVSNFQPVLDGDGCTVKWMYRHPYPDNTTNVTELAAGVSEGVDCYGTDVYPIVPLAVEHPQRFHRYQVLKACVDNPDPIGDVGAIQPNGTTESIPQRDVLLFVEDRDCSQGLIYVRQGYGGSRAVAIPADTEICIMYSVAPECPDPVTTGRAGYSADENYLQRFYTGYSMSEKASKLYYEGNITAQQEMEDHRRSLFGGANMAGNQMTGKLPLELEQALVNGIGYKGDAEGYGRMKGLWSYGIPHYQLSSLNYPDIKQIFLDIDNAGSSIDESSYMMIGSNEVQSIMDEWASYRTANDDSSSKTFGYGLNRIETSFGSANFTRHKGRALRPNQILIIDTSKVGLYIDEDWKEMEIVGGTNLCAQFEIWGLFTLLLACPCHHALITIDNDCFQDQCCGTTQDCRPQPEEPVFCAPNVVVPEGQSIAAPLMC